MSIPVPEHVTRVEGCDCGGLQWHATTCTLWKVDHDQRMAAVGDAERRLKEHTAELNRQLRAFGTYPDHQ